ncbi:MAG: Crp/Fnr family transcriptional regulator [Actinomycetota bacterium]
MATTAPRVSSIAPRPSRRRLALAKMDLFAGLPERDLAILEARLPIVFWPRGAEIPDPLTRPDHLYLVREGRIALFERTAPGHEIMVTLLESGAVYSTLGHANMPSVASLDGSAVSPLPAHALETLMARYPRLGRNLAGMLSDLAQMLGETVALVSEMKVEDRLRARLHQLSERFGVAAPEGVRLQLDLTHAQWASLVGASREAVTTAFGKLRTQGAITVDGRAITLSWDAVRAREARIEPTAA